VTDKTVVLIHGAWHGAWCWDKVTPLLDGAGVDHVAVELPLESFEDDVAAARAAIVEAGGPVVLCGHSYGGAVITEAGHQPNVERLVYVAAFACDEGESPANAAPDADAPSTDIDAALIINDDDGVIAVDRGNAPAVFYHDCAPEDVETALRQLRSMQLSCLTTALGPPAWKTKPSTYVVCSEDRGVHPELQRAMAKRCNESVEWPTAHSPFLNRPDLVADLLIEVARA
jgi:pimeloyl-ACP methyl ester carboxylesterase